MASSTVPCLTFAVVLKRRKVQIKESDEGFDPHSPNSICPLTWGFLSRSSPCKFLLR